MTDINLTGVRHPSAHGFSFGQKVWIQDVVEGVIAAEPGIVWPGTELDDDLWWTTNFRSQWWMIPVHIMDHSTYASGELLVNYIHVALLTSRSE